MKKNAFTFWEAVVTLTILVIAATIILPMFTSQPTSSRRAACQFNLKQIILGIKQYNQDYDEKYPLANSGRQGWMDIIMLYTRKTEIFQCPTDKSGDTQGTTDYFYNARLAGREEARLKYAANIIMLGEGVLDSPPNASFTQFSAGWATNSNSPAWRHLDGANYGYADGHVKWLRPASVSNDKASESVNTFALW